MSLSRSVAGGKEKFDQQRTLGPSDGLPDIWTTSQVQSWPDLAALLQQQGKDRVPEEAQGFYPGHRERFQTYLRGLDRLREWGEAKRDEIDAAIGESTGRDPREYRKAFAALAVRSLHPGLAFAALDGGLDRGKLRKLARTDEELREILGKLGVA